MDKRLSWSLRELDAVPKNGFRVFSTFACAGGSTMGYKRAGFEVVGANDIDEEMAKIYRANHKPGSYFLGSIRDLVDRFRREGVPDALRGLDILDGSPPCTPFSSAKVGRNGREWGKAKAFREGQAVQVLDDLFFSYLELVDVLRPRVFVAENVTGLTAGKAKGYAKEIALISRKIGFSLRVLKIKATTHGVPQKRERLFFIGRREGVAPPLRLPKADRVVTLREAFAGLPVRGRGSDMREVGKLTGTRALWEKCKTKSQPMAFSHVHPRGQRFNDYRLCWDAPSVTLTTQPSLHHPSEPRLLSVRELFRVGSFPDDFRLTKGTREQARYVVGMSVPPFVMEDLSAAIAEQWL